MLEMATMKMMIPMKQKIMSPQRVAKVYFKKLFIPI